MWYEDQYKLDLETEQIQKEIIKKDIFNIKYPDTSFDDLQKQNKNICTDDGHQYYRHTKTDVIYSCNINNEWNKDIILNSNIYDKLFG